MVVDDAAVYRFFDRMANDAAFQLEIYDPHLRSGNGTLLLDISSVVNISRYYQNLMLIYDSTTAKEQILLINNIQKIFRRYFQINGIERLISTNYCDIEWSMFLEFDFNKGQPKYYRDHFVHQFRDAYLSIQLFNECKLHEHAKKVFSDNSTVIAKYINNMIEKQRKFDNNSLESNTYYGEIIFKATLLAAIFHDLGYPLSYFSRISNQVQNSLPFYKVVSSSGFTDFLSIHALLSDSLLFRTVQNIEIKEKYNNSDHGTMSAICFLLNFYYTGGISDLSPIDRCIIELAARTIYDHTNEFKKGQRMIFYENPLSYVLRISDDLQEWSRFTFAVGQNSNSMICQNSFETISTKNGFNYNTASENLKFIKTTGTEYKKLNYISACSQIQIESTDKAINIQLDYDLYKMLELSVLNFSYATYRVSELRQLKKMFPQQKELPNFIIKYNLSNNVFFLSNEIKQTFLEKMNGLNIERVLEKIQKDKTLDLTQRGCFEEVIKKLESKELVLAINRLKNGLKDKDVKTRIYYLSDMDKRIGKVNIEEYIRRLTTNEYSYYLSECEKFLSDNLGLLGLMNRLISFFD